MKTLRIVTAISVVLVLFTLSFGQATTPPPAPNRDDSAGDELTGLVSDAICKGMHFRKALTPFSCTLKCVHDGADYVLVVGETFYILEGHRADLDKFAGGRATVRGHVNGDRFTVDSVTKAEKRVQGGTRTDG